MVAFATMTREIPVHLGARSYRVLVAPPAAWGEPDTPEFSERGKMAVLVTEERVGPLWAGTVREALRARGLQVHEVWVPEGEASKDLSRLPLLYDSFLATGLKRDGWVIALGGGVIGDLAGFAASTYMRGIAFAQVPTSLIAMADASVGGKVGVNYAGGKNLIGAFHQPRIVLTSPSFLSTLPDAELANGLAEVIKAAIIGDRELFGLLESRGDEIWRRDPAVLDEVVGRSIAVKAEIVGRDELDLGERQLLNLGHTFGHALEAAGGFDRLRHGEAVAIGLMAACRLSILLGLADVSFGDRVAALLDRHRLPTHCAWASWEDIAPWMSLDKKAGERGGTYILTGGIGDVSVHRQVPEASVREAAALVLA
jgi:3-dehydroquinate synthase